MIEYLYTYLYTECKWDCEKEPIKVRLDGKIIGEIRKEEGGYRYHANGRVKAYGGLFPTIGECQQSLQEDNTKRNEVKR